jgi:sensor histidine kinase YesM
LLTFFLFRNIRAKNKAYIQLEKVSTRLKEQALQLSKQAKLIAQFQSQMNPHFVYNALHNIQGLVLSQETQKANTQIQSLAQLMRKTFANAEKDDIPIEEEISYLQKYIEFEKNAFDNNLAFEIEVDTKAQNVLIPPMMIQPFVENSIKHAGLKKIINPYIKVLIEIENNLLAISIKDNGLGIKKNSIEPDKLSHSVSVIKSRLNLLFNGKADVASKPVFSIQTFPEIKEGTSVKFYLPLQFAY